MLMSPPIFKSSWSYTKFPVERFTGSALYIFSSMFSPSISPPISLRRFSNSAVLSSQSDFTCSIFLIRPSGPAVTSGDLRSVFIWSDLLFIDASTPTNSFDCSLIALSYLAESASRALSVDIILFLSARIYCRLYLPMHCPVPDLMKNL